MDKERQLIAKTERMIDEIKAVCGEYGLSNTGNEYKIIADSFLYKYCERRQRAFCSGCTDRKIF